jgi:hypothetical protein
MDIGSIFLILGLLLLVVLFISRPFYEYKASSLSQQEQERSALLAERDRVLTALQELDFDHALGKIPQEDYPAQRLALLTYGADILRKLDAFQPQPVGLQQNANKEANPEDRLEAAIAARAALRGPVAAPAFERQVAVANGGNGKSLVTADDDLEVLIANRRRSRPGKAAGFCPKCGGPLQRSDRFCPKCGAPQ